MASKKPKGPRRILKRKPGKSTVENPMPPLPDRRATEGVMQGYLDGLFGPKPKTPLSRAQDVMYRAFETTDPDQRSRLAREALEICPDCADAYVVLGEMASSRKEALKLFEQGVAAAERALGPDTFANDAGHF
jgi:hypothetical protein